MRKLFIRYVNGSHIIWLCSTSSHTQVICNYSPQSWGTAETLVFWLQASGMALYLQLICPAGASLQMNGGHNLFRLNALVICDHCPPPPPPPAQENVEDFDFKSAVPHSNHHTVGTSNWQNHDSSPLQPLIILHYHGYLCLSNTFISSAL